MKIYRIFDDRVLFYITLVVFIVLMLSVARFPLWDIFDGMVVGDILTSNSYIVTLENLLIGYLAAYIFYVLNDYLPRIKRKENSLRLLNSCIASVVDSYSRTRVYGHETALPYVDTSCLDPEWLRKHISVLKLNKTEPLKLKFALDTAHTRTNDFNSLLQIAVEISPEHAEKWLVVIDKVRLLAENYGEMPTVPDDQAHLVQSRDPKVATHLFFSDLEFRLMELMEATLEWLALEKNS